MAKKPCFECLKKNESFLLSAQHKNSKNISPRVHRTSASARYRCRVYQMIEMRVWVEKKKDCTWPETYRWKARARQKERHRHRGREHRSDDCVLADLVLVHFFSTVVLVCSIAIIRTYRNTETKKKEADANKQKQWIRADFFLYRTFCTAVAVVIIVVVACLAWTATTLCTTTH